MKLVILDRDGVINHDSDAYIKSADEWRPIDGSLEAIGRFTQAGWRVMVASNQSGLARGLFSMDTLGDIHAKMRAGIHAAGGRLDGIFFCPHGPDDNCPCRKPRPGLLHEIARRLETPLTGVPLVGDSLRDLQAAAAAGCTPWLVRTGKGAITLARDEAQIPAGTRFADSLAAVADQLLEANP